MESTKKTAVTSSMVDLKAELFRKQEEFKRQKAAGSGFVRGAKPEKNTKGGIWNQQNAGVLARAKKDESSRTSEEDDIHIQSRKALEEKARLYDKLCNTSNIPDEDGSDYYLVDFQKKVIDSIVEGREADRKREAEEEEEAERVALAAVIPKPANPDEEWIDFKDSLGRDRRCMKKDLDHLMKQDRDLALAASRRTRESAVDRDSDQLPSLMSTDMHREIMRQKWEDEMKELQEKGQQEIHYSNVQFDEIRAHGVGFFQFSKDHEKREEQLDNLKKMREETVDEHSRKERIKDKRKAMIEARLAKVRQRRNLKEPVPEVKSECDEGSETIGPKLSEASLASTSDDVIKEEEMKKQAEEKRKAHVREWDRGKQTDLPGRKSYVEVLRDEREPEFAPPSLYFEEPKNRQHHPSDSQRLKRLHTSLKTTNEDLTSTTNSGNGNVLLSSRCDDAENKHYTEDKTQGTSSAEEVVQEYISGPEKSQIGEQLPQTDTSVPQTHQHNQTNGHPGTANSWTGSNSVYENVPYYGGQPVQAGGQSVQYGGQPVQAGGQSVQYGGHPVQAGGQSVQYGGQLVQAGGQSVQYGGHPVQAGGQSVQYGGQLVQAGGQSVQYGAQLVQAGGQSVQYGGQLVQAGGQSVQYGGQLVQAGGQSVQYGGQPVQAGGQSVQYGGQPVQAGGQSVQYGGQPVQAGGQSVQYGAQPVQAGMYGQTEIHFESPCIQQYAGYQHYYMPLQQQQQHHNQWPPTQYISTSIPHQHYNVNGAGNPQLTDFTNTGFSSGATGVSDTSMAASMQPCVDVQPRKAKIPKMSVVDTRYMKNEEVPPVEMPVNAPSVTAVPYVPGSFTAAKQTTAKLYEESIVESGLKHQISGNALLYTKDQLAKQELLPLEGDGESYKDTGSY